METQKIIPEAPIVRISSKGKGTKYFVVRCPYCTNQHYHAVGGGLGNRIRHCIDLPFMSKRAKAIFLGNKEKYGKEISYDIIDSRHS
jgi:hypothetical protein